MAKQGLVRVPFYPQLNCLNQIHPQAGIIMSALLFWMTRNKDANYTESRHNYQLALHLGIDVQELVECLKLLKEKQIFDHHIIYIEPKEKTTESKVREEERLTLNFVAFQRLLASFGTIIDLRLLLHAADDNFDFYDVIDLKELPLVQKLNGKLEGESYEKAALIISKLAVYVNEYNEEFALQSIAPGWKILLTIPMNRSYEEYAQELSQRFLRKGERAIDFNFTDGNFFLPDYQEIKSLCHQTFHYGKKKEARDLCCAFMLALSTIFPEQLSYVGEYPVSQMEKAILICKQALNLEVKLNDAWFTEQNLSPNIMQQQQELFANLVAKVNAQVSTETQA